MSPTKLVLVGGFLGSGKTTLLARAFEILKDRGLRVAIVTNDQAAGLVDTELLRHLGAQVEEIAGGCFCCKFTDLVSVVSRIALAQKPDVIIGEPVGSCVDISRTVFQPLKRHHAEHFCLSPFSVLVDPQRLREVLDPTIPSAIHPSARYILRKQLEEADFVVLNKVDTIRESQRVELERLAREDLLGVNVVSISALTGEGVDVWLDKVLSSSCAVGDRVVDVDYDIYAEGEAVLGWLYSCIQLLADQSTDWRAFCATFLTNLRDGCRAADAEIAHVKLILATAFGQYVAGNITSTDSEPTLCGEVSSDQRFPELTVNARVQVPPDTLEALVKRSITVAAGHAIETRILELVTFSPSRPIPTYRYQSVV